MPALALAENETDAREYLSRQLSSDGFEVYAAASGREVLELAERAGPDLVLVESALPDGSGLEVCRRLREGEPGRSWNREVPLIMLGDDCARFPSTASVRSSAGATTSSRGPSSTRSCGHGFAPSCGGRCPPFPNGSRPGSWWSTGGPRRQRRW